MRTVETVLRMGAGGVKEHDWGDEYSYCIASTLLNVIMHPRTAIIY
jgi:hypothetical protein